MVYDALILVDSFDAYRGVTITPPVGKNPLLNIWRDLGKNKTLLQQFENFGENKNPPSREAREKIGFLE